MGNSNYSEFSEDNAKARSNRSKTGSKKTLTLPDKSTNWPGLPGPGQKKDRSAGVKKSGYRGSFHIKQVGL